MKIKAAERHARKLVAGFEQGGRADETSLQCPICPGLL